MFFQEIALLLVAAAVFGVLAKLIKQPLIVGYLLGGIVIGSLGLLPISDYTSLGKIGVALLLFLIGLEMNLSELPSVGKVSLIAGLGQIGLTSIIGVFLARSLGFGPLPSIYVAVALTFSSTVVIVKLLSEKNDLESLYGRISIGLLLVQDLVAILILMFLSGLGDGDFRFDNYLLVALKGIALIIVVWALSRKVLPALFARIVDFSTELLFIVSIAWALGLSAFVGGPLGFSVEIGGFLAGLSLSSLPDHLQISARTRPLRDFFLTLFFITLGTSLVLTQAAQLVVPVVVFSLFVLIGKPIIVLVIMGLLGYRKRTSFLTSITEAQVSEFSLILMAMGLALSNVTQSEVTLVIMVGIITMIVSTYTILDADKLYRVVQKYLSVFEQKVNKEPVLPQTSFKKDHIVLVGSHRTGASLLPVFRKKQLDFVVVDFNPNTAGALQKQQTPTIFGDITDPDILNQANVSGAKLVISTTNDLHDNLVLLNHIKVTKSKAITILKSSSKREAMALYKEGADYVVVPEVLAGEYIRHILKTYGVSALAIRKLGRSHLNRLVKV